MIINTGSRTDIPAYYSEWFYNRIKEIEAFRQIWYVTLNPYGVDVEPNVPKKEKVMESLRRLSDTVGIQAVFWRYDPIFITDTYSVDVHIRNFS